MQKNHIPLDSRSQSLHLPPSSLSSMSFICPSIRKSRITEELEYKIRKSFIKLFKILNDKKLTLYKTFKAYDEGKKGRLELKQFEKILLKLDANFTSKEMKILFELVDKDESNTIEFDQLNAYYCTLNGVPEIVDLPPEHYYAKSKVNYRCNEGELRSLANYFKC